MVSSRGFLDIGKQFADFRPEQRAELKKSFSNLGVVLEEINYSLNQTNTIRPGQIIGKSRIFLWLKYIESGFATKEELKSIGVALKHLERVSTSIHPEMLGLAVKLTIATQKELARGELKETLFRKLPADVREQVIREVKFLLNPSINE